MENRAKMSVANRAKQFAPFAAVVGLDRAIAGMRAELDRCERRVFSEERAAELDGRLRALRRGMRVSVGYYADGAYHSISGPVTRIEPAEGLLKIGPEQIRFADISELYSEEALPFFQESAILSSGDAK